jgi:hypothetical protein
MTWHIDEIPVCVYGKGPGGGNNWPISCTEPNGKDDFQALVCGRTNLENVKKLGTQL